MQQKRSAGSSLAFCCRQRGGHQNSDSASQSSTQQGSTESHQDYSMHRAGITAGLGGMVGNLANGAYATYHSAKRGSQVTDKRLKALYAAQAAYQAYDTSRGIDAYAGTANSHADTRDGIAQASHIASQGDIAMAATDGDLRVIGNAIDGRSVILSATHDLNLASQAEQNT